MNNPTEFKRQTSFIDAYVSSKEHCVGLRNLAHFVTRFPIGFLNELVNKKYTELDQRYVQCCENAIVGNIPTQYKVKIIKKYLQRLRSQFPKFINRCIDYCNAMVKITPFRVNEFGSLRTQFLNFISDQKFVEVKTMGTNNFSSLFEFMMPYTKNPFELKKMLLNDPKKFWKIYIKILGFHPRTVDKIMNFAN